MAEWFTCLLLMIVQKTQVINTEDEGTLFSVREKEIYENNVINNKL